MNTVPKPNQPITQVSINQSAVTLISHINSRIELALGDVVTGSRIVYDSSVQMTGVITRLDFFSAAQADGNDRTYLCNLDIDGSAYGGTPDDWFGADSITRWTRP